MGRAWVLGASIVANLLILSYLGIYIYSSHTSQPPTLPPFLEQVSRQLPPTEESPKATQRLNLADPTASQEGREAENLDNENAYANEIVNLASDDEFNTPPIPAPVEYHDELTQEPSGRQFPCDDVTPRPYYGQRAGYWVLYNYIRAEKYFRCDESITYTTHADWTFLDNLVPLLERWQGPVSLAVYAPSKDFDHTLSRVLYLRECASKLVKEYVTFHIVFDVLHMPDTKVPSDPFPPETINTVNCFWHRPSFGDNLMTYKKSKKLAYPINIARNIARESATTHYIFPSDIELYPSPNVIPDFFKMLQTNDSVLQKPNPRVFVLSIFELEANVTGLPRDKPELVQMLGNGSAIPFHKYVCSNCHKIPMALEWMNEPYQPGLRVFHVGKRHNPYHHWEPIYIGTKDDPRYDERLSWEGQKDKMTQGYILCVLDYDFLILDNAFLTHRPGVKRLSPSPSKEIRMTLAKQATAVKNVIYPELQRLYGKRPGCII